VQQTVYCCFIYKHWSRNMINIQLPALIKAESFADFEMFGARATQGNWAKLMLTKVLYCLFCEQQSVCRWVNSSSGNVGCQRTVNSMQLKLPSVLFSTDECCTQLLLVVVKCVKCRIGLLLWYRTMWNNMYCCVSTCYCIYICKYLVSTNRTLCKAAVYCNHRQWMLYQQFCTCTQSQS